jgi:hypothetical protein
MKLEMEASRRETAGAAGEARRGVVYVLAAATLMGTSGTTASFAPATAGPVSVGAARLVVGGLGLLLAVGIGNSDSITPRRRVTRGSARRAGPAGEPLAD